jgi:Na+-transporting methylmalonyl-CoA/oxaloacetate decarboxylase gamma subunit
MFDLIKVEFMQSFYIVIGGIAIIFAVFFLLLRRMSASGALMLEEQRIEGAPEARAKILAIGKSRALQNDGAIIVRINFEVFPHNLQPSFQTSTIWEVEPAMVSEIAAGKMLAVKFDVEDNTRVYPLAPWAKLIFCDTNLRKAARRAKSKLSS